MATTTAMGIPTTAASKRPYWLVALICFACAPAIAGRGLVAHIAAMHGLAASHPYFHPEHAALLYLWMPVVAVSSFLLYLSPGLFLALSFGRAKAALEIPLLAFGSSVALSIALETGIKIVFGTPLAADVFLGSWTAAALASALLFLLRVVSGRVHIPSPAPADVRRILWAGAASLLSLAILTPKIFWENFNVDGTEAFEFGRSLAGHVLPHWDIQGGVFGFYHNFVLFAYPNHWFIALFGPVEASVRLPFVLFLALVFFALILLIEHGCRRRLGGIEEAALWMGLASFAVVQVYNTTYDPFFADMAEPGATDLLMLACFFSACYFLWTDRLRYFVLFAAMTYLATVGGSALLIALAVTVLLDRNSKKREQLKVFAALGSCCALFGLLHETLYNHLVLGGAKDQFSTRNMAARLFPPSLMEFGRLGAVFFPSGLLPAISVAAARPADWIAWSTGIITVLYAGVIYAQSWTALHQFTPVMVLPLIVFWRLYLNAGARARSWLLPSILATTAACIFPSLPRHFQINVAAREFGAATAFEAGDYGRNYETAVHAAAGVLGGLLPADYRVRYPRQPWGIDDETWVYYSFQAKSRDTKVNYFVRDASAPAPGQASLVAHRNGFAVYVRDRELWMRQRNQQFPQVIQSPLYEPILRRTCEFFRDYIAQHQKRQ